MKRSTDGGLTWSVMRVIEDPGEQWSAANPSTVVDGMNRRIWLFYLRAKPGVTVSPVACAIARYTLRAAGDDRDRILWSGPRGPERMNLVIRISYDEGETFPVEHEISEGYAAYSDITILKDRTVGVLWERGVQKGYQFITFTRLSRDFLETQAQSRDGTLVVRR
jgi:hypothetical protein